MKWSLMHRTTILLADSHSLVMEGMQKLLVPEFCVAGVVDNSNALIEKATELCPNIIVSEVALSPMHGFDVVKTLQEAAEVPGFPLRTLTISSVALARSIERLPPSNREYDAPFVLRDRRVVRHPNHLFRSGDDLSFFYETYGLMLDPIDGRPEFDVEYRFFLAGTGENEDESGFSPLGHPIRLTRQKSPVQDFSIPLHGWSRGLYRLRVTVDDTLADRRFSREVTFQID